MSISLFSRRFVAVAAVAIAVLAGSAIPALSAEAAAPAATTDIGWVRLAHLSPDTRAVNVRVTSAAGKVVYELNDVGYGAVSPYQQLPGGAYAVLMVPSNKGWSTTPLLSSSFKVVGAKAITVAAFGSNKKLKLSAFDDDLTPPQQGTARIRLIQASTKVATVDVDTTTGLAVATAARAGSATSYTAVPAGPWSLALSAKGVRASSEVVLQPGSVTTLLVLDSTSGLSLRPILDSAAVAAAPIGGVNTGGGWLAEHPQLLHAAP